MSLRGKHQVGSLIVSWTGGPAVKLWPVRPDQMCLTQSLVENVKKKLQLRERALNLT